MELVMDREAWMKAMGVPACIRRVRTPVMDRLRLPGKLHTRMGASGQAPLQHPPGPAPVGAARPLVFPKSLLFTLDSNPSRARQLSSLGDSPPSSQCSLLYTGIQRRNQTLITRLLSHVLQLRGKVYCVFSRNSAHPRNVLVGIHWIN